MPAPRVTQTKVRTRLGYWRTRRGLTQRELWEAVGLSRESYRRLERGQNDNPPVRWLTNLALALDVPREELIEDHWKRWTVLDARASSPPDPSRFLRSVHDPE